MIAENITWYREREGWTQKELGEKLGLKGQSAKTTVYRMEAGLVTPSMKRLKKLARIFGVTLADMVEED